MATATKNVTACTLGATPVTGITRFTVRESRPAEPVHVDNDTYNSCVTVGSWSVEGSLEGVDKDILEALEGVASASLTVSVGAADGGGLSRQFVISGCHCHSFTENIPEPGSHATATIQFVGVSANGSATALTVQAVP